ncbi:NUMOD4 motif-containing HNH endonuclease, partial [Pseudomonas luteola]|uniref:NUMOD4 motif-containing HNH endonuclease n=1 Tax=Pseudomonas luteola TaxID=47886 RepID=UPI003A83D84A
MMQEVWKPIPGYESYYEVSSFGRVRSFDRSTIRTDGKRFNKAGRVLKPNLEQRGYLSVRLCVETVHKIFKVHRLVARAFLQAPHEGQQINHINGIKTDNRPENLEWVNPSENVRHAFDIGLCKTRKGVNNSRETPIKSARTTDWRPNRFLTRSLATIFTRNPAFGRVSAFYRRT